MLEIAGVFRWNVTCVRLTVANRRAADRSRVLHQRRGRGRACEPSRGCRASDGLRNCCAIAELRQQHNYSDQVSHDSISPVWGPFSRRGPARDRRRPPFSVHTRPCVEGSISGQRARADGSIGWTGAAPKRRRLALSVAAAMVCSTLRSPLLSAMRSETVADPGQAASRVKDKCHASRPGLHLVHQRVCWSYLHWLVFPLLILAKPNSTACTTA
jgi:hypothetical protein